MMTPSDEQSADDAADPTPAEAPDPALTRKARAPRRVPRSDAVLEAAVERAREGILEIASEAQVGRHVSAVVEGERLVTHRFEAFLPGYAGWQWYASLARIPRAKVATVCEVGLLPSDASLRAPAWVPWSQRVRPEDHEDHVAASPPRAVGATAGPEPAGDGTEQPVVP